MDTSSGSDSFDRTRGHKSRSREAHSRRPGRDRDRGRTSGRGGDRPAADISEKISTLADTLQDTSRNLTKVDRMLCQYQEHTDDQAEAMALLKENLEESINQLQTQRLSRSNGARSASASGSASTLHTSDLEAGSGSDTQRFYPTSPLRDYTDSAARSRRRSQSAGVRFRDSTQTLDDIHSFHQSLRDLRCDQLRLSDDLDREILRRNRSDIDTRRAMESLSGHVTTSLRQDPVSSRVERRLQELEREMSAERERRPEQRGATSDEQQEPLTRRRVQTHDREESLTAKLLNAEAQKTKMEQELERARRLLEQSEDGRESLAQQVEDMRNELLRMRKEKVEVQRTETSQTDRDEGRVGPRAADRLDLEKEVAELRVQLCKASVVGEVEELKRVLDRKEKERVQLSSQVEELSSELIRREHQQLRMLEQLREIQSRAQAERRETEASLQEITRSRDDLKIRAQDAVRQWRAKCKRLQKELDEAVREKQSSQTQLKALSQQTEADRRELAETLGRLAQREEEFHRKDVELSETRQRQLSLEQEVREVKEASAALEEETRRQAAVQSRLREENQRLEERADTQTRRCQIDQDAQDQLQATLKKTSAANSQLAQRLAEEENCRKELQRNVTEMQVKLTAMQLERDAYQKEVDNMKTKMEDVRLKKERDVQEAMRLLRQERDEIHDRMKEIKVDAASSKELNAALRVKLDRMKDECDKLATQLNTKDRKYQLLKQELDDQIRSGERKHLMESELREKVLKLEADQEAVLTSMGEELDAACRSLAKNGGDKLQAISQKPGLVKDAHHWLAETKTKLRWLCEEMRERDTREQRLKKLHQQTKDQLKSLRQSRDSEQDALLQRLRHQEKLLDSLSNEKKDLLERSRRKEEEMRSLQDRVLDLETSTRVALNHLDSLPEKPCLMENFKDLEESQREREMVEQRYTKYKEIVWDLQHQLDESKRRVQEYRDEKLDATSRSLRLAALSSSIKDTSTFLSSSLRSDTPSPRKRLTTSDLDESSVNEIKTVTD